MKNKKIIICLLAVVTLVLSGFSIANIVENEKIKEEAERIADEKAEQEAKRIADEKAKAEKEAEEEAKKETTNISTKNSATNTENTSYVPSGAKLTASAGYSKYLLEKKLTTT